MDSSESFVTCDLKLVDTFTVYCVKLCDNSKSNVS